MNLHNGYMPALKDAGFKMDGYFVWCSSVIKENGTYYMFAARWPKETKFPEGYMTHSEIVLATTDSLDKPFRFQKVVIGKREGNYWDSTMAHNPFVVKIGSEYVMYYIGTPDGSYEKRAIGYATAKSLDGEWTRSPKALNLPADANNPSVMVNEDNSILLYFRDGSLKVHIAAAKQYNGEYTVVRENIFPKGRIEDMFAFKANGRYEMFAEDEAGKYTGIVKAGVRFVSENGLDWDVHNPPLAYGYDVEYTDGTKIQLQRRERPQIFADNGKIYLFTTAKANGPDKLTGGDTWNMLQELK